MSDPRTEVLDAIAADRAIAIVRAPARDLAAEAMEAAVRGGFRLLEFTLNTPAALELVAAFAARSGLLVGAGTVLTVDDARAAVRAGARFLVSPVVDPDVIAEAARLGVPVLPGASTPTECLLAHRLGAPLVKIFPAPAGGPAWVRAVLGPLPFLRLVPTQGADATNAAAWLAAGAHAIGFGATLFAPDDVAARRWDAIEARARAMRDTTRPGPA